MADFRLRLEFFVFIAVVAYFTTVLSVGAASFALFSLKDLLYYIIIAPIVEEFIFRAILQKYLLGVIKYRFSFLTLANVLVSLLFACLHLLNSSPFHSALVFVPSLVLGFFYERSKSVLVCIFFHALFNLNIFLVYNNDILSRVFTL